MKIAFYNTKPYDHRFFESTARSLGHEISFFETRLTIRTAALAVGHDAVCIFVNDQADRSILEALNGQGSRLIALRCAGFNNIDLAAAKEFGITVVRVPAYSPHAVAEHTVALILALNRCIHRAYNRVRDGNFALNGLMGFDLHGQTVGVIGTGTIGAVFARIMSGFGCKLLGHDIGQNQACLDLGMRYVERAELFAESDIISLHCPLTPNTHHLIDAAAIEQMKKGVMIVNTSRGAVIDTAAVVAGLKSEKIGHLGLDVYEEEADVFFEDLSNTVIPDDTLSRLLTFPNVIVTGHQAFFTREALQCIAQTTMDNVSEFEKSGQCQNSV